jgi:hypothetical protein
LELGKLLTDFDSVKNVTNQSALISNKLSELAVSGTPEFTITEAYKLVLSDVLNNTADGKWV